MLITHIQNGSNKYITCYSIAGTDLEGGYKGRAPSWDETFFFILIFKICFPHQSVTCMPLLSGSPPPKKNLGSTSGLSNMHLPWKLFFFSTWCLAFSLNAVFQSSSLYLPALLFPCISWAKTKLINLMNMISWPAGLHFFSWNHCSVFLGLKVYFLPSAGPLDLPLGGFPYSSLFGTTTTNCANKCWK